MSLKIAVLMGGASFERKFSLASGQRVCEALEAAGHKVIPLDTTSELVPTLRRERPDVVYSALHGKHGEDGTIQSLLELLGIPFVGASAAVARSTYHKATAERRLEAHREAEGEQGVVKSPAGICMASDTFKDMGAATALDLIAEHTGGFPVAVKPACGGSALGVHKVYDADGLGAAILDALSFDKEVIIDRWIDGVEVAVSVIGEGDDARVLSGVEIAPRNGGLFDTDARMRDDAVDYFAPPRAESLGATEEEAAAAYEAIKQAALEVYRAYGVRDLGRVDLVWDGTNAYVLEVDVSPGMTPLSLFPTACEGAGLSLSSVLDELVRNKVK